MEINMVFYNIRYLGFFLWGLYFIIIFFMLDIVYRFFGGWIMLGV